MALCEHFPIYGHYLGTTKASPDVEGRARVNGFVGEYPSVEASAVQEGNLLYLIDKPNLFGGHR